MVVHTNFNDAQQLVKSLQKQSKAEVFAMWCATCLGRIHSANMNEQRKAWMIYDIVLSKYGMHVADQIA